MADILKSWPEKIDDHWAGLSSITQVKLLVLLTKGSHKTSCGHLEVQTFIVSASRGEYQAPALACNKRKFVITLLKISLPDTHTCLQILND